MSSQEIIPVYEIRSDIPGNTWSDISDNTRSSVLNIESQWILLSSMIENNLKNIDTDLIKIIESFINKTWIIKVELLYNISTEKFKDTRYVTSLIIKIIYELNQKFSFDKMKIISDSWKIEFEECLTRINWINLKDFLDFNKSIWLSICTFYMILSKVFSERVKWPISINAHVSDINNDSYIYILELLSKRFYYDLSNLTIEVLEDEKIPNYKSFIEKIKVLEKMWIKIALDDIKAIDIDYILGCEIVKQWLIDYVKIDWEYILNLYKFYINKEYISDMNILDLNISTIKMKIKKIKKLWIKVIAEYIETEEIKNFCKEQLWIDLYQWIHIN